MNNNRILETRKAIQLSSTQSLRSRSISHYQKKIT